MSDVEMFGAPLEISCTSPGFRRGGMAHAAGPATHPAGTFTLEQYKQLEEEPRLFVTVLEAGSPEAGANASDTVGVEADGGLATELLDQLVAHIGQLDRDDDSLWNQDGSPAMKAMPDDCTTEQRDAAWAECLRRAEAADQVEG